jgi:hypothetical protein
MLYATEEQRSRRPIFIATLRAARLLASCFVAHRSKTTAGILPLRFAHLAKIRGSATIPVTDLVHYFVASRPFNIKASHPPKIPKPPSGVIAPIQRMSVKAKRYNEPLKTTIPPKISQKARRGIGFHLEITNSTTAWTK